MYIILLQFRSSNALRLKLLNTGSDMLIYAAEEMPLGIQYMKHGVGEHYLHQDENWLGQILMSVRDKLVRI